MKDFHQLPGHKGNFFLGNALQLYFLAFLTEISTAQFVLVNIANNFSNHETTEHSLHVSFKTIN